jgi:uncharacterized membrane protein
LRQALRASAQSSFDASVDDATYHPRTVRELTERNIQTIVELENAAKLRRTRGDRIADAVSRFCGSMTFVWMHIIWFGAWVTLNTAPFFRPYRFGPFPFTFLTLVVSLEAIFLSTFILISQNLDARLAERRNQLDLQINLLSEQENTKMLQILTRIAAKVGAEIDDDPDVRVLEEATRPDQLIEQIDQSVNGNPQPDN